MASPPNLVWEIIKSWVLRPAYLCAECGLVVSGGTRCCRRQHQHGASTSLFLCSPFGIYCLVCTRSRGAARWCFLCVHALLWLLREPPNQRVGKGGQKTDWLTEKDKRQRADEREPFFLFCGQHDGCQRETNDVLPYARYHIPGTWYLVNVHFLKGTR